MTGFIVYTPRTDGIEVFQSETKRIDFLMAIVAGLDGPVLGVQFADG